jgi:hypothetical protein
VVRSLTLQPSQADARKNTRLIAGLGAGKDGVLSDREVRPPNRSRYVEGLVAAGDEQVARVRHVVLFV